MVREVEANRVSIAGSGIRALGMVSNDGDMSRLAGAATRSGSQCDVVEPAGSVPSCVTIPDGSWLP